MKGVIAVAVLLSVLPASAQLRAPGSYIVAREHVARAVAASLEIGIAEAQARLVSEVVAREPTPTLEVRSTMLLGGQGGNSAMQLAVKMACRRAGTCLPFYAVVEWPDGVKLPPAYASVAGSYSAKVRRPGLLRAGARARLLLEDGQMRMEVPVIALRNAGAGERVRVTSLDRRRT
jgi:hypothetical protein